MLGTRVCSCTCAYVCKEIRKLGSILRQLYMVHVIILKCLLVALVISPISSRDHDESFGTVKLLECS